MTKTFRACPFIEFLNDWPTMYSSYMLDFLKKSISSFHSSYELLFFGKGSVSERVPM